MAASVDGEKVVSTKYSKMRVIFYIMALILLGGDVESNPGPSNARKGRGKGDLEEVRETEEYSIADMVKALYDDMKEVKNGAKEIKSVADQFRWEVEWLNG
ncbi:hypothetical protein SNE40_013033 [Patella caerulea]|uniref:Uncharacterized protein n=1 Tax=Patella caerulea TaxID=87958 RepID=A0AAN8JM58_PATCE